jgi:arsenate reductase (glutaredoxin)
MFKIYHNSRCRKSRAGLEYLAAKGVEYECIEYLKNPISEGELKDLIIKLNLCATDVIRKQEEIYKKQFRNKEFTEAEWIKIILEYPALLKRPIIVRDYKAVIADPPENLDILLKK